MSAPSSPRQPHSDNMSAPATEVATSDTLLADALAFWRSTLLLTAHELGIFAQLARAPRAAGELAGSLGLRPKATADFLEALVAHGYLCSEEGLFRNSAATDHYLDPEKPLYIGRWLDMARAAHAEMRDFHTHLRDPLSSPQGQALARRMWDDIAEILASDSRDAGL